MPRPDASRSSLPDHVRPGVRILLVGINPGMRSAALGHHFAGHSNRFWKLLHASGLVPGDVGYERDAELPRFGLGITNLIERATPGVSDLGLEEFRAGRDTLLAKIARWQPQVVALVGVTVYRAVCGVPTGGVRLGWQEVRLHGARVFVLPNPSGRNAHHSLAAMQRCFRALGRWANGLESEAPPARRPASPRRTTQPRGLVRSARSR